MTPTSSKLNRTAGLSAVAAGLTFIIIQPIHPTEELATVTGSAWAITGWLTVAFAALGLIGVSGIYHRQAKEAGVVGFIGYAMFSAFFVLTIAYSFVEIYVLPPLVDLAPQFVESWNGIVTGDAGPIALPALEAMWTVVFVLYFFGSTLLGIGLYRARMLPRWAPGMLVLGAVATLTVPLLPHATERYVAVPMGLALIALGYLHWSERRETETVVVPDTRTNRLDLAAAE